MFLLALFAGSFSSVAEYTLDDISPHFSTNTEIVWKAPMSGVPKSLWIYKKLPRVFSETTISNAIILASFQNKGFPQASTNQITLWADRMDGELRPPYFEISPQRGEMSYSLGDRAPDTSEKVSNDEAAVQRAWNCLFKLGIDRAQFIQTNVASPGTWGVFLPRQIDGIQTLDESEGFSFQQFGDHGKIRFFSIVLPGLKRDQNCPTASPKQIVACIRAFKTPVVSDDKTDYFKRINNLANAKTFTITRITLYYGEDFYGETPTKNEASKFVTPIAELEATADFGASNATVRLFSPILSSEAIRLSGK